MKTEYNLKDTVWIHMGERKLTKGRVVEIIDLEHLDEGHDHDYELYVIQVQTGIDPVYEVRDFGQISPDPQGPIALFRREGLDGANRFLKKVGLPIPQGFDEWSDAKPAKPRTDGVLPTTQIRPPVPKCAQPSGTKPKKKRYYRHNVKKTTTQ